MFHNNIHILFEYMLCTNLRTVALIYNLHIADLSEITVHAEYTNAGRLLSSIYINH